MNSNAPTLRGRALLYMKMISGQEPSTRYWRITAEQGRGENINICYDEGRFRVVHVFDRKGRFLRIEVDSDD